MKKGTFLVTGAMLLICFVLTGCDMFGEAVDVTKEEIGPRAALTKYEWFIDQAASIGKMDRDIANFRQRVLSVEAQYAAFGEDKTAWPPDVRMQYNRERSQARDDLLAVISQRNGLVREYNAASSKFNWAPFKTRPDLPPEQFEALAE